jgi:hypothetical protein
MSIPWKELISAGVGMVLGAGAIYLAIIVVRYFLNRQQVPATVLPLPKLGTNPADEISGVTALPVITRPQLEAHCSAKQEIISERLGTMNRSLTDTNKRIERMDIKLDSVTRDMRESVGELREVVAVIKDRTNRRD